MPDLSTVDAPLRAVMKKEVDYYWGKLQQNSFAQLKEMCCSAPTLAYYDVNKEVTIQCDASSYALGGVLLQDGHPIAYTSRALTSTEARYAQIEKEMLSIVHCCKKFHHYIFSKPVAIENDHKPLEAILTKPLLSAPMRLQSMMLRLQPYDLNMTYKPGKQIPLGDTLSRANLPEAEPDIEPVMVNMIDHIAVTPGRMKQFQECTAKELNELHYMILKGWPDTKQQTPHSIRQYWNIRDELSVADGIVFKGMRIVVPPRIQSEMLKQIHESHLGITKCKQRGREALFWPGMSTQIENLVNDCTACNTYQNNQNSETLKPTKTPDFPWSEVGSDVFEWEGCHYLLTVDYFSKYIEVDKLSSLTTADTITAIKMQISRHGLPEKLRTDNAPNYSSREFQQFCKDYDIEHVTSSPNYPKSNGESERAVQTVKRLWAKCNDKYMALLDYRTTPLDSCGLSPAQLSMSRRPRNKLPISRELLKPKPYNLAQVKQCLDENKEKQRYYHDKKAGQDLPVLTPGDPVRIAPFPGSKQWAAGTVVGNHGLPRSYIVKCGGRRYRRNRKHIRVSAHNANPHIVEHHTSSSVRFPMEGNSSTPPTQSNTTELPTEPSVVNGESTPAREVPIPDTEESNETPAPNVVTRSGRTVKPPQRMDL